MHARVFSALAASIALLGAYRSEAQVTVWMDDACVVIPPCRPPVMMEHAPRRTPSITLTKVEVNVEVRDQVASTSLAMTLTNTGAAPEQAQLLLPVPDGSTVRSFTIDGLGSSDGPGAVLLPRDEARRIYHQIVSQMRDPGLLEFAGYAHIRSSVFPVPPGGSQTVTLVYEQVLPSDQGRVDYVLPRTEGLAASGVAWSYNLDFRASRPIATVYSPSHDLAATRVDDGRVRVRVTDAASGKPGSLRVSYLTSAGDGLSATMLAYPDPTIGDGAGGYFLLLAGLPDRPDAADDGVRREVTIVLDRSGSMRGGKIEQAGEAALQVLEGLRPGELFNIVDYSDSIAVFAERPVVKSDQTMAKAREYLAQIRANGGTNIHDALVEALRQPATPGCLPIVLFLTDGLPTVGQTSEVAIREAAQKANLGKRRIFTFGVGLDVNAPLLTGIARATRATGTFVLPDENVEVKVGQVFRKLSGPIFASGELYAARNAGAPGSPIRELQPGTLPDIFDGDQLVILGQYTGSGPIQLVLHGDYLGQNKDFAFTFDPSAASVRNAFVPRLWATRKIASLVDAIRQSGADSGRPGEPIGTEDPRYKELVDEIVALSIQHGILTEYTAFLATEQPTISYRGRTLEGEEAARLMREDWFIAEGTLITGSADEAPERAGRELNDKAVQLRDKSAGVSQELNLGQTLAQACVNPSNEWLGLDMKKQSTTNVCQVSDRALFHRAGKWVDASILKQEFEKPDRIVKYGTTQFEAVLDRLIAQNRQGMLAMGGDVYLSLDGQRVLVVWDESEPKPSK